MSSDSNSASGELPVYKVGLVMLRKTESGEPQVLLIQPKPDPKKSNYDPSEEPPFVLPRGSRHALGSVPYRGGTREGYEDVRTEEDAQVALASGKTFEPLTDTLLREAEEEAGVSPGMIRDLTLYDLGVRDYHSPRASARVQWYVLPLDEASVRLLRPNPTEAKAIRWVTLPEMRALAVVTDKDKPKARLGYVPVVEEAIDRLKAGKLPEVTLPPSQRSK